MYSPEDDTSLVAAVRIRRLGAIPFVQAVVVFASDDDARCRAREMSSRAIRVVKRIRTASSESATVVHHHIVVPLLAAILVAPVVEAMSLATRPRPFKRV